MPRPSKARTTHSIQTASLTRFPRRRSSDRCGSAVGIERVADRADRAYQIAAAGIERFAQPPDMDIDGAQLDLGIAAPYPVEQLLAGEHAAGVLQEMTQQPVLGRAEMHLPAAARHAMRDQVH